MKKNANANFVHARIVVDEFQAYGNRNINQRLYVEGDFYVGYIVLVTEKGKIVAKKASHDWLLDDEWLARCRQTAKAPPP